MDEPTEVDTSVRIHGTMSYQRASATSKGIKQAGRWSAHPADVSQPLSLPSRACKSASEQNSQAAQMETVMEFALAVSSSWSSLLQISMSLSVRTPPSSPGQIFSSQLDTPAGWSDV